MGNIGEKRGHIFADGENNGNLIGNADPSIIGFEISAATKLVGRYSQYITARYCGNIPSLSDFSFPEELFPKYGSISEAC